MYYGKFFRMLGLDVEDLDWNFVVFIDCKSFGKLFKFININVFIFNLRIIYKYIVLW